jgi:glycosyltransferase involved in cell wall biosynthesis
MRLAFVGRLIPEKGVTVLLEALGLLRSACGEISCEIIGDGPLMTQCQAIAGRLAGRLKVKFLGPVEYGAPLFSLLEGYDAVVVPSLSDEQPRIVYDAYARAIPVLGFKTDGLLSCIKDGETGRLCRSGSARDLADLIDWAAANRTELKRMGMAGLSVAKSLTHREMHRRRCETLAPLIANYMNPHA